MTENQRTGTGRFAVALLLACVCTPVWAQAKLEPGELPVRTGLDLINKRRLPTLAELEAKLDGKRDKPLVVFRLSAKNKQVHAPRWCQQGQGFLLAFQQDVKKDQSKAVLQQGWLKAPKPVLDDEYSFENMFLWALGDQWKKGYCYGVVSNISGTPQIHFGSHRWTNEPLRMTAGTEAKRHPAIQVKAHKNRVSAQVVFDAGKELAVVDVKDVSLRADQDKDAGKRQLLGNGTQARWSPNGKQLAYVREIYGEGEFKDKVIKQEITVLTYQLTAPVVVHSTDKGQLLRSPEWSKDGSHLAYYLRQAGTDPVWDLYLCDVRSQLNKPKRVGKHVVIETVHNHVGPAWSADGQRLYFFSQNHREEEYYPVQWIQRDGKARGQVHYPKQINVANGLNVRSWGDGDLVAFTAIDRGPHELYVMILPRTSKKPDSETKSSKK